MTRRSAKMSPVSNSRRRAAGFTLLELMIVVGIVAILASLAMAGYDFATVKSRRGAAKGCLTEAAQFMERYYTTNMSYTGATFPPLACTTEQAGFYTFSVNSAAATTFSLQAVPQGRQATKDARCGTLGINQTGVKTISGGGTVTDCW